MALKEEDDEREVPEGTEAGDTEGEIIAVETPPEAQQQDERVAQRPHDEDDDEGQGNAATDAEREARRLERRARKEREKAAKERNRKELEFLRQRNEVLERRFSAVELRQVQSEAAIVEQRLSNLEQMIREAEALHSQAVSEGKGAEATEAMRIRDQFVAQRNEGLAYKQQLARQFQQAAQPQQQQAEQPQQQRAEQQPEREDVSPELLSHADKWRKDNPWYKHGTDDEASQIVAAIDAAVYKEGFDPETPEYWQELSKRVANRLPEKVQQQRSSNGAAPRASGGPAMANAGRADRGNLKPGEIYVSPERKAALMEMGVWDDPKLRQRYLKRYQQYDAEAGKSRSA